MWTPQLSAATPEWQNSSPRIPQRRHLSDYYHESQSYSKWLDFFIVLCYMALFRVPHWAVLTFTCRNYGHKQVAT